MGLGNVVNYIVFDNPISKATISVFSVSLRKMECPFIIDFFL